MAAARLWTVGVVFPEDGPSYNIPHSLNILIKVPEHIKSMLGLEMELDDTGSKLTLVEIENPSRFSLVVQLPMRIDGNSIAAKFRKKRRVIEASAKVKTVEGGQPPELLEAVQRQRLEYLNSVKEADAGSQEPVRDKIVGEEESLAEAPPEPAPNLKALHAKYKKIKEEGEKGNKTAVVSLLALPPNPPIAQKIAGNESDSYDNFEKAVQGHPSNRLQLVSPEALISIVEVCLCLALASKGLAPSEPQNTVAKVMASFYSQAQSELCRQLLVNLAQGDDISKDASGTKVVISPGAREKWVRLAKVQQLKITKVLVEKVKKQEVSPRESTNGNLQNCISDFSHRSLQALLEQGRAAKGGKAEKKSTRAHAPVFDKNDENSEPQLPSHFCSGALLISAKNSSGCLSALLTKSFKGSEKRRVKQFVGKRAELTAEKLMDNGFAILEGFVLPPKVVELRTEIDNLQPHFTPSEIWVGKGADVGAQISVPDVRGDKVLWMCGGHKEVDR